MIPDRILPLQGVNNFRDYGGYAVVGGGRVRARHLWRSGQHVAASDADLDAISALGIGTVIDLRGDSERVANPCRRAAGFSAQVLFCAGESAGLASHLDAAKGVMSEEDARSAMCRLYSEMPYRPNLVAVLRQYFRALAEHDGASLIHCYAGKDRTGFSVALTHSLLGVHPDDALEDYLLTNRATEGRSIPGTPEKGAGKYDGISAAARQALGGVDARYLQAAFGAMCASHGSVERYMADVLAVDPDLADRIRSRFVQ